MQIVEINITPRRRANLVKLANYLEGLPEDYSHFDMYQYSSHHGECDLLDSLDPQVGSAIEEYAEGRCYEAEPIIQHTLYAKSIEKFLSNCGAIACALGHGPAAGILIPRSYLSVSKYRGVEVVTNVDFDAYAGAFFVSNNSPYDSDWSWMFSSDWGPHDNHHWGAAARIRLYLDFGGYPADPGDPLEMVTIDEHAVDLYASYRIDNQVSA